MIFEHEVDAAVIWFRTIVEHAVGMLCINGIVPKNALKSAAFFTMQISHGQLKQTVEAQILFAFEQPSPAHAAVAWKKRVKNALTYMPKVYVHGKYRKVYLPPKPLA